ncbi:Swt21p NDAI_0F03420 [Naumovozyma dairenensis CBS 421]|uniref:Protein SWT21 n=1 Tax=Naumovozyma dairenensis (strain ATCC 10597 / BCRC 20456 / CBS 421 / NBRC 0211 / NRRL Y-12639) TaxID=1071378 RepID=G0WCZ9_NAUDC|nr:hypothetical protein NDAI_0F03420 [Naumovozyma dairenensis CBS 421]CCD25660.1 hypothetical protein NDAI_0F03420 [Naumovozyma dairenensis CBS 421]
MGLKTKNGIEILGNTGTTFQEKDLRKNWAKEDDEWAKLVSKVPNYNFPILGRSMYETDDVDDKLLRDNICQDLRWSYDGTSLVSVNNDYGIRQYLIPEDNEEGKEDENFASIKKGIPVMVPFTRFFKNQSIVSSEVHPLYSLFDNADNTSNGFNNCILLGLRNMPIQLYGLTNTEGEDSNDKVSSIMNYNVMNEENEKYEVPYAMKIGRNSLSTFLVGFEKNKVGLYSFDRKESISIFRTRTSTELRTRKSIISCFSDSLPLGRNMQFAGSYKNEIFSIDRRQNYLIPLYKGSSSSREGAVQLFNSNNGNYLFVLKRNSATIEILDCRFGYKRINELQIPFKLDNQKFRVQLTEDQGLYMGTNRNSIINWSKDLIEFGGITRARDRDNSGEQLEPEHEWALPSFREPSVNVAEQEEDVSLEETRVNIICTNPKDESHFAYSYCVNKQRDGGPTSTRMANLGIALGSLRNARCF